MKKVRHFLSLHTFVFINLSVISLFLAACGSVLKEPTRTSNENIIADPRPYALTADDDLGINENGKGREVGYQLQGFELTDIQGQAYAIENSWSGKPALVVFYRGGWCPYCNMQVRELSENYSKLKAAGVQPVLISVDTPDSTANLTAKYEIPFPVLSDPNLVAHQEFNVVLELNEAALERMAEFGITPSAWSGLDHNSIAVASVFIVDQSGKVLLSHAPKNYASRPTVDQLLEMIKRVQ